MANVILKNEERCADTDHILKSYGYGEGRCNSEMREAAEVAAARTNEAIRTAETRRKYY